MSDPENVFLKKGSLKVTSDLAVLDGESYKIADIKAVSMATHKPGITVGLLLSVSAVVLGVLVTNIGIEGFSKATGEEGFYSTVVVMLLIGAVCIACAVAAFNTLRNREETFQIVLKKRGNTSIMAMESTDRANIETIINAINQALKAK